MEEGYVSELGEETDIYTESGIEEDMDNDGINGFEQGFMQGYLAA